MDPARYSPLALAYMGDCLYDVIIKTIIIEKGNRSVASLHKMTTRLVNATTQSTIADALQEELTEEEMDVYRRGRNAKSYTTAKNATVSDYRRATGLEALIGYLYLQGKMSRVMDLLSCAFEKLGIVIE